MLVVLPSLLPQAEVFDFVLFLVQVEELERFVGTPWKTLPMKMASKHFVSCFPWFRDFLDAKGLIGTILVSKKVLDDYDGIDGENSTSTKEFLKRYPSLVRYMEDSEDSTEGSDGGVRSGSVVVKNFVALHRELQAAFEKLGRSTSLRVDTIIEISPKLRKYYEPEIYHTILQNSAEILSPAFVAVVVQFARRGLDTKEQGKHSNSDQEVAEMENPLEMTLHEYRWGAHNPIGFRARDVEVISNFTLSPRGEQYTQENGEPYYCEYECVGDGNLFDKLEIMREKSKTTSLMQCLTPSVIWIGGQRRADIASRGP